MFVSLIGSLLLEACGTWELQRYRGCEGVGDVVGVVTPLAEWRRSFSTVSRLSRSGVVLRVHQDRGEEEDGEGQVEVEREEGEVKENHTCMTME